MTPQRPTLRAVTGAPETATDRFRRLTLAAALERRTATDGLIEKLREIAADADAIAAMDGQPSGLSQVLAQVARVGEDPDIPF